MVEDISLLIKNRFNELAFEVHEVREGCEYNREKLRAILYNTIYIQFTNEGMTHNQWCKPFTDNLTFTTSLGDMIEFYVGDNCKLNIISNGVQLW